MQDKKVDAETRDYFKEKFTAAELKTLIGSRPIADFISTRTKTYKEMGWDKKTPTKAEAIAAMVKEPTLLKRPILIVGDQVLIGYSQTAYEALTAKKK